MVFYFTGTGNCLYVAKEISRRVEGCSFSGTLPDMSGLRPCLPQQGSPADRPGEKLPGPLPQ